MAKILIIDNSNLACRAFYGTYRGPGQPLLSFNGQATNAISTWAGMLTSLMRCARADEVFLALDGEPTRRLALFPAYKAGRLEKPRELKSQLPIIAEIVRQSGFSFLEDRNEEGDDMIIELARRVEAAGDTVAIASADKDFSQIISPAIHQMMPVNGGGWTDFGPAEVQAKYGLPPSQMMAYLSLIGDTADNTPGIEGIGPGRAVKLLAPAPSFEDLCAGIGRLKKDMDPVDIANAVRLNFSLITPLPVPNLTIQSAPDASGARSICLQYNCKRAAGFFEGLLVRPQGDLAAATPIPTRPATMSQGELF